MWHLKNPIMGVICRLVNTDYLPLSLNGDKAEKIALSKRCNTIRFSTSAIISHH